MNLHDWPQKPWAHVPDGDVCLEVNPYHGPNGELCVKFKKGWRLLFSTPIQFYDSPEAAIVAWRIQKSR